MTQEWLHRIALTIALRNQPKNARALLDTYGSATAVVERHPELVNRDAKHRAEQEATFVEQHGIQTYFYQDEHYPYRLAQCADAPLVLYSKGNMNVNPKHAVSVVGTRKPSENGKEWCRRFVLELAQQVPDLTIISGLAYGIDIVAHRAALEAGIPTLIIPAHGLDRIYPALHRNVAVAALEQGGILTEYPHQTEPERYNFVARNRIVAGMADALVVVESKSRGGSLITAQMAQDYSRDVFALPGRFNDTISEGCNDLIKKQRAQLITSSEDFIQAMQWEQEHKKAIQTTMVDMLYDLNDKQRKIIDKLTESEEGLHVNQLVMELQIPYNEMVAELMMLELNGIAKGLPGGLWRRVE